MILTEDNLNENKKNGTERKGAFKNSSSDDRIKEAKELNEGDSDKHLIYNGDRNSFVNPRIRSAD